MLDPLLIGGKREPLEQWAAILFLIPTCLVTCWIIVSNALVMLAVFGFRHMRTPSNIYIASLASTDFLVGCLVLPLSILQIVKNEWTLGQNLCKVWLTLDVTLSTLSILNLIAIAVDRYRVVSEGIVYLQKRSMQDVISVVIFFWCIAIWIATPPVLGWGSWAEIEESKSYICDYSSTWGYVIHSALGSFVFPLTLMIYTYFNIYKKIQQKLRERASVPSILESSYSIPEHSTSTPPAEKETSSNLLKKSKKSLKKVKRLERKSNSITQTTSQIHDFVAKKIRFSLTKERRAARTLGIIIGAFMISWMPFCIMYILRPIAGDPPLVIYHSLTWLGYLNSAVNPIIYCIFSSEYKQVFQQILCMCCCCKKTQWRRERNVSLA